VLRVLRQRSSVFSLELFSRCGTLTLALMLLIAASSPQGFAQNISNKVVVVNFSYDVDPGTTSLMNRVVKLAESERVSAIVIQINTPGGLLKDTLSIISSISQANESGVPTYTYVPPNSLAASAGSYIAQATNRIVMGEGSVIGPSTAIVVGGSPLEQNHTEAAALKLMVSLATRWGRNATSAYNMVYSDQAYSAEEAYRYHLVNGIANSLTEALDKLGLSSKEVVIVEENAYEQFLSVVSNPILAGILVMLGVLAIVIDLYHPTVLLTVAGVLSLVAGLVGVEVVGASVLGFLIIVTGAAIMLLELKLGHGFMMMIGVLAGTIGVYLLAQGLHYYGSSPISLWAQTELFSLVLAGILGGLYMRWIIGPLRRKPALVGPESLVGKTSIAATNLSPEGEVRVDGIIWRARSISGNVVAGESVKVRSREGLVLLVEKKGR
jgi:membrane-bound serine protease (ClpP class)